MRKVPLLYSLLQSKLHEHSTNNVINGGKIKDVLYHFRIRNKFMLQLLRELEEMNLIEREVPKRVKKLDMERVRILRTTTSSITYIGNYSPVSHI